jgi:hypothetical protein
MVCSPSTIFPVAKLTVDARYGPKISVKTTNKKELAFLVHMLLIKPLHSICPWRKLCMEEFSWKQRRNTPLWSKEKSANQSLVAMQASHGLEGPQLKQTDSISALSSTRGTSIHQEVTQPKLKSVGARASSSELMIRLNQPMLHCLNSSMRCLQSSPQCRFHEASAILLAESYWSKPINTRGLLNKHTKM